MCDLGNACRSFKAVEPLWQMLTQNPRLPRLVMSLVDFNVWVEEDYTGGGGSHLRPITIKVSVAYQAERYPFDSGSGRNLVGHAEFLLQIFLMPSIPVRVSIWIQNL